MANKDIKAVELVNAIRAAEPFLADGMKLHRVEATKLKGNTIRTRMFFRADLDVKAGEKNIAVDTQSTEDDL